MYVCMYVCWKSDSWKISGRYLDNIRWILYKQAANLGEKWDCVTIISKGLIVRFKVLMATSIEAF
jgi:hypothetical protein